MANFGSPDPNRRDARTATTNRESGGRSRIFVVPIVTVLMAFGALLYATPRNAARKDVGVATNHHPHYSDYTTQIGAA
jgi:hypothetical protein